jgi:hypothetical protein
MTREGSQTRMSVPEEDSGPPRPHTPSPSEQADGSPEPINQERTPRDNRIETTEDPDEHLGATEDQVSDTVAPSGDSFKDEPKQG